MNVSLKASQEEGDEERTMFAVSSCWSFSIKIISLPPAEKSFWRRFPPEMASEWQ
jgi:hypothetical protein